MPIIPLRNMVLLRLTNGHASSSKLHVIQEPQVMCVFAVVACGPEVLDIQAGQTVLANRLAGTAIGGELLLPDTAILGTL